MMGTVLRAAAAPAPLVPKRGVSACPLLLCRLVETTDDQGAAPFVTPNEAEMVTEHSARDETRSPLPRGSKPIERPLEPRVVVVLHWIECVEKLAPQKAMTAPHPSTSKDAAFQETPNSGFAGAEDLGHLAEGVDRIGADLNMSARGSEQRICSRAPRRFCDLRFEPVHKNRLSPARIKPSPCKLECVLRVIVPITLELSAQNAGRIRGRRKQELAGPRRVA
jgi:hypothetical protein